jgi:hypothetical protein
MGDKSMLHEFQYPACVTKKWHPQNDPGEFLITDVP